jgi:hypothetical protein
MLTDAAVKESGADVEWTLTPKELGSLRSIQRLFVLGLGVAAVLALGVGALTVRLASQQPRAPWGLAAPAVICVALVAVAIWCAIRARIVGQDIRIGRAEMQWGRVTRAFRRLRVAEVEGIAFPLQMTTVPTLRAGERVRLRFAPRSRLTLQIQTLREVVAAERMAGRDVCPGVLAELGEQPHVSFRPGPTGASSGNM